MARFDTSFNFGANKRKPKKGKGKAKKDGSKSNAWQAYVGCGAGCRHMRYPPFLLIGTSPSSPAEAAGKATHPRRTTQPGRPCPRGWGVN